MATLPALKPLDTAASINSYNTASLSSSSASKPKFWQFFSRRKTSDNEQDELSVHRSEVSISAPLSQPTFNQSRPSLSVRSKSESIVPRKHRTPSKSLQKRKRSAAATVPPPLMQVYSQAIIHSTLEVPGSPRERGISRPTSPSSKDPSSVNSLDLKNDSAKPHQRTGSRSSLSSLREKLIFLTASGLVLQYDVSGNEDRLPEKILELNREAVAFASDALTGHPWVLQISSKASIADASHPPSLKTTRSRLNLRLSEPKRKIDTLYLVFNDPEDLYSWLFSVRKEIESLGGMEYRPDTRGAAEHQQTIAVPRRSKATTALQRLSRSSSALPLSLPADAESTTTFGTHLQAPPMQRSVSSQSAASSSVESATLDKMRDSMFSDSSPSTTATAYSPESTSPTRETFSSNSLSPDLQSKPMPAIPLVPIDSVTERIGYLNTQRPTIQERRSLSVSTSLQHEASKMPPNQDKDLPEPPPQSPEDEKTRPLSVVAPLPHPSALPRSSRNGSRKCSVDEGYTSVDSIQEKPHVNQINQAKRKSTVNGIGELSKAKYSLFPTPISVPPIELVKPSTPPQEEADTKVKQHRKARSRTLTLELPSKTTASTSRLSPTTAEFDKAQRSPAVTIEMIEANFGATPLPTTPSPIAHKRVPSLSDFGIDDGHLSRTPSDSSGSPPSRRRPRKLSHMKSMPNMDVDAAASLAKIPAGPPPTGPLPAVPADASPSSSRKSSATSEHKRGGTSSSFRAHSRNHSLAHSRNPSLSHTQQSSNRARNTSQASVSSSSCSTESPKTQTPLPDSHEPFGPMFPPRISSTRHMKNRTAAPPRAIDTHRQRQRSRGSEVACAM